MKIKGNFVLREVGGRTVAVSLGGAARGVPAGRHGARHGGCADPPPDGLGARAAADG